MQPENEFQQPIKSEIIADEKLMKVFAKFMNKYCDLVWYARSPKSNAIREVYDNQSKEAIENILNNQARIEEMLADETSRLNDPEYSDWQHGFHSGCLATMRYVVTAMNIDTFEEELYEDDDGTFYDMEGNPAEPGTRFYTVGGLEEAEESFPDLDS